MGDRPEETTGFAFPPLPRGNFASVSGADAVEQSLWTLLLTEPGERVERPKYGAGLRRFLFEPNTVATRTSIRRTVLRAIERFEPRAQLESVEVHTDPDYPTRVLIDLRYTVTDTTGVHRLEFPLSLDQES
jgi:uncharacterized protein